MLIEEAIYERLSAVSAVTDLLGTPPRIYPQQAPQSCAFPVVVYQQANQRRVRTLTGFVSLSSYDLHLDCYGETYTSAKAVWDAVRDALNGYKGELGSGAIAVRGIFDEGAQDGLESPVHAEEDGIHRVGLDLSIWFR